MKPIGIENRVLLILLRTGGGALTLRVIHDRVGTVEADDLEHVPEWRTVAKAVYRLQSAGLVSIVDDEPDANGDMHPLWGLTRAGESAAHQVRVQMRNARLAGTHKTTHDNDKEVGHA